MRSGWMRVCAQRCTSIQAYFRSERHICTSGSEPRCRLGLAVAQQPLASLAQPQRLVLFQRDAPFLELRLVLAALGARKADHNLRAGCRSGVGRAPICPQPTPFRRPEKAKRIRRYARIARGSCTQMSPFLRFSRRGGWNTSPGGGSTLEWNSSRSRSLLYSSFRADESGL